MKSLARNVIYQGKNFFRDSGQVFWTILFPIILVSFFNLAFSGLTYETIEDINVGVSEDNPLKFMLEDVEEFNIYEITDESYKDKLINEEIHVYVDEDMELVVSQSGISQSIIKEVVEQIKQAIALGRPIEGTEFQVSYIKQKDQESNSIIVIYYALIAMVSAYALFIGIETVSLMQANLSNVGIRLNVTPLKKESFLVSGTIVAFILNIISNIILLLFLKYVLKLDLFTNFTYSFILIIIGNLFGVALGVFLGASSKKDNNTKTAFGIAITLFFSFLSGLNGPGMKSLIDEKAPIIGRINPFSIITNNLYRINLIGNTETFPEGIVVLGIYIVILLCGSYFFLRRRTYDSI